MYERLIALKRMLGEACVVQSEVWEVMGDLTRVAFGTPMFSRRLDAGYCTSTLSIVILYWSSISCLPSSSLLSS